MVNSTSESTESVISRGYAFADLELPNADEETAKAQLALAIRRRIAALRLTQSAAAARLGTDQAKVSRLVQGKIASFSLDRLIRFANALDMDVRITVEPAADQQPGRTLVNTA